MQVKPRSPSSRVTNSDGEQIPDVYPSSELRTAAAEHDLERVKQLLHHGEGNNISLICTCVLTLKLTCELCTKIQKSVMRIEGMHSTMHVDII